MTAEQFSNTLGIDLLDKSREVRFTYARFAVYYYLRRRGWCLMRIADMFGYKSHSSIINGLKQMETKLSINDDMAHGYWKKLLVADSARIVKLKLGMAV
ncbi:hypothetical protein DSECCO2_663250 [anaerobic digester metagenome]